jgi:hypothetical protein
VVGLRYEKIYGLKDVYLEDSYVQGIVEMGGDLTFVLLAVLCEEHPSYEPPPQNEQHCYRMATLVFPRVRAIRWVLRSQRKFRDAEGAVDLGNIHVLRAEHGAFHLEGEWGILDVASNPPILRVEASED